MAFISVLVSSETTLEDLEKIPNGSKTTLKESKVVLKSSCAKLTMF